MSEVTQSPTPSEYELQRRANRDKVRALGFEPYGVRDEVAKRVERISAARAKYNEAADKDAQARGKEPGFVDARPIVTVSGRVMLLRDNGKLIWSNLRDSTGDLQIAISQKDVDEKSFALAKHTDLGDVLIVTGKLMKTKTGEMTVWASSVAPAAKCLVVPPAKHDGLEDVELRYRQRYVDLWVNPETLGVFELRSKIVSRMRRYMESQGYLEVETPMLQTLAGGAAARPFVTKMNALDINLFMRIAPELYLKRLLVGGMPKVYEINRNFRNEGLDKQHNPEFTMLEAYDAYGDMETVMNLTEGMIRDAATMVFESGGVGLRPAHTPSHEENMAGQRPTPPASDVILPFGDYQINYTKPFARRSYADLFEKAYGFPMSNVGKARDLLISTKPNGGADWKKAVESMDDVLLINELFEDKHKGGEAQLDPQVPTFITYYPSAISPLTRPNRQNPAIADRADLFIAGMEIAPHYTELNDPDVQESKFREQLKGLDAEKNAEEITFRTMDHDFLRCLKVGMPPAGGMGLGIDRLTMLLTNQRTIRDVVLFPLMRLES